MNIRKVIIIGSGIMGSGIAQVIGQSGINVNIVDTSNKALDLSKNTIEKSLNKLLKKKLILPNDVKNILNNRLKWFDSLNDASNEQDADLIIEAVPESENLKRNIILSVNQIYKNKKIIYASNTSSISITKMAQSFYNPDCFIGMHFMNPVPIMKLVEIIPGLQTHNEIIKTIEQFSNLIGKTTVQSLDRAGFIANRILIPMINEGFYALMEKLGTPDDIDKAMKLGCNFPMGPLQLADFIGLDTCLHVANILHVELGDSKYRACPLLKQYVAAGWLGRKTGRGVYLYS